MPPVSPPRVAATPAPSRPEAPTPLVLADASAPLASPGHPAWRPAVAGVAILLGIGALVAEHLVVRRLGGTAAPVAAAYALHVAGLALALVCIERGGVQAVPAADRYALAVRERLLATRPGRRSLGAAAAWAVPTAALALVWGALLGR